MSAPRWFKSSFSDNANACVEVLIDHTSVSVRDSKQRFSPVITVSRAQWATLQDELTGAAPVGANGALAIDDHADGGATLRTVDSAVSLHFTPAEWRAYLAGVREAEFRIPA